MTHVPHELAEEFPESLAQISELKQTDQHFSHLFEEYHAVNRAIHRAETDLEPTDDFHMQEMRKQRLHLKDQIARILAA
jgi:uncharacterized protein YdcH (DUF465 family)